MAVEWAKREEAKLAAKIAKDEIEAEKKARQEEREKDKADQRRVNYIGFGFTGLGLLVSLYFSFSSEMRSRSELAEKERVLRRQIVRFGIGLQGLERRRALYVDQRDVYLKHISDLKPGKDIPVEATSAKLSADFNAREIEANMSTITFLAAKLNLATEEGWRLICKYNRPSKYNRSPLLRFAKDRVSDEYGVYKGYVFEMAYETRQALDSISERERSRNPRSPLSDEEKRTASSLSTLAQLDGVSTDYKSEMNYKEYETFLYRILFSLEDSTK